MKALGMIADAHRNGDNRKKVVRCPETGEFVEVVIAPYLGLPSALGGELRYVKTCSRWPGRKTCTQYCLKLRILDYLL
jgi:hypothetical protein